LETTPSVRVARGATYFFAQGLVGNTAAVVYFAIAARLLPSVSDFGVLAAVTMVAGLFPTFASLALPTAVTHACMKTDPIPSLHHTSRQHLNHRQKANHKNLI